MSDMDEMDDIERLALRRANVHHDRMCGMTDRQAMKYVKTIIANNDLVFGVFRDAQGIGFHIIKGRQQRLSEISCSKIAGRMRVDVIPCIKL